MKNLNAAFLDHEKQDGERFERIFDFTKARFDKIDTKLDTLWDGDNRRKGMSFATTRIGMAIWAVFVLVAGYFINNPKI